MDNVITKRGNHVVEKTSEFVYRINVNQSKKMNVMLKDELRNCQRSNESLKEQLSKTKKNMLIIIDQYKEKVNLAAIHRQVLRDEQAKVSA